MSKTHKEMLEEMDRDYLSDSKSNQDIEPQSIKPNGFEYKNKYLREIKKDVFVDVYDVLKAWGVKNPALQHLIKKALQAGNRGHKDLMTDMQDIIDSAARAKELEEC